MMQIVQKRTNEYVHNHTNWQFAIVNLPKHKIFTNCHESMLEKSHACSAGVLQNQE